MLEKILIELINQQKIFQYNYYSLLLKKQSSMLMSSLQELLSFHEKIDGRNQ